MKTVRNQKKRYGLLVAILIINWMLISLVVWKVDPDSMKNVIVPGIYLPMMLLIFGGLFLLFSILFLSAKRALRWTVGLCFYLVLRVLDLGSVLNGGLILGILVTWELYVIKFVPKIEHEVPGGLTGGENEDII